MQHLVWLSFDVCQSIRKFPLNVGSFFSALEQNNCENSPYSVFITSETISQGVVYWLLIWLYPGLNHFIGELGQQKGEYLPPTPVSPRRRTQGEDYMKNNKPDLSLGISTVPIPPPTSGQSNAVYGKNSTSSIKRKGDPLVNRRLTKKGNREGINWYVYLQLTTSD